MRYLTVTSPGACATLALPLVTSYLVTLEFEL